MVFHFPPPSPPLPQIRWKTAFSSDGHKILFHNLIMFFWIRPLERVVYLSFFFLIHVLRKMFEKQRAEPNISVQKAVDMKNLFIFLMCRFTGNDIFFFFQQCITMYSTVSTRCFIVTKQTWVFFSKFDSLRVFFVVENKIKENE